MLHAYFRFDKAHWEAASTIAATWRQNELQAGMKVLAKMLVIEAQLRCPHSFDGEGTLENDYRLEVVGTGWGTGRVNPWTTRDMNYKVVWGEKTKYSKEMDQNLEVGSSQYSFDLREDKKLRLPWAEDPQYRLDKGSVLKEMVNEIDPRLRQGFGADEIIEVGGQFLSRAYRDHVTYSKKYIDTLFANANRIIERNIMKTIRGKQRKTKEHRITTSTGNRIYNRANSKGQLKVTTLENATSKIKIN